MMHGKSRDTAEDSEQKLERNESTPESLLQSFLTARDPESAATLLDRLLQEHAQPLIRDVVKFKVLSFGGSRQSSAEQQDICQDVIAQLLATRRPSATLVGMTEREDVWNPENSRRYGFRRILSKPYSAVDILEMASGVRRAPA